MGVCLYVSVWGVGKGVLSLYIQDWCPHSVTKILILLINYDFAIIIDINILVDAILCNWAVAVTFFTQQVWTKNHKVRQTYPEISQKISFNKIIHQITEMWNDCKQVPATDCSYCIKLNLVVDVKKLMITLILKMTQEKLTYIALTI